MICIVTILLYDPIVDSFRDEYCFDRIEDHVKLFVILSFKEWSKLCTVVLWRPVIFFEITHWVFQSLACNVRSQKSLLLAKTASLQKGIHNSMCHRIRLNCLYGFYFVFFFLFDDTQFEVVNNLFEDLSRSHQPNLIDLLSLFFQLLP